MTAFDNTEGRTPGEILRVAREAKGVTLEEASRVTRIGTSYLSALEEDRYERLPNPAYLRGFLRSYATFLGIPPEEPLAAYDKGTAPPPETAPPAPESPSAPRPSAAKRCLLLLPLLLLIVGGYFIAGGRRDAPPPVPVVSPQPFAPPAAPAAAPAAPAPPAAPSAAPPAGPPGGPAAPGVLRISVISDGHLTLTIDDDVTQEYDLRAGDLIEWKGRSSFVLDLSNPAGVEAQIGGRKITPVPSHLLVKVDGTVQSQ